MTTCCRCGALVLPGTETAFLWSAVVLDGEVREDWICTTCIDREIVRALRGA